MHLHHYVYATDPNPESGGLEKQFYRACSRCGRSQDRPVFVWMSGTWRLPDRRG